MPNFRQFVFLRRLVAEEAIQDFELTAPEATCHVILAGEGIHGFGNLLDQACARGDSATRARLPHFKAIGTDPG